MVAGLRRCDLRDSTAWQANRVTVTQCGQVIPCAHLMIWRRRTQDSAAHREHVVKPHAPCGEQEGCWNVNYSVTVISWELSHRPWMLHRDRAIRLPGAVTVIENTAMGWVNASPCFASPCALNSKWPT